MVAPQYLLPEYLVRDSLARLATPSARGAMVAQCDISPVQQSDSNVRRCLRAQESWNHGQVVITKVVLACSCLAWAKAEFEAGLGFGAASSVEAGLCSLVGQAKSNLWVRHTMSDWHRNTHPAETQSARWVCSWARRVELKWKPRREGPWSNMQTVDSHGAQTYAPGHRSAPHILLHR